MAHRSLQAVVAAARERTTAGIATAQALLRLAATSELAARTLFEAAGSRLNHLSTQARGYARQSFRPDLVDPVHHHEWCPPEQIAADVISLGFEWITRHAGTEHRNPVQAIRDWVRDQLRVAATKEIRHQATIRALTAAPPRRAAAGVDERPLSAAEAVAELLTDAVDRDLITVDDAQLIFATRVLDQSLAVAAATRGMAHDSLRHRRRAVEATLRDHHRQLDDLEPVAAA